MMKKILCLLLAMMMVFSLVACGEKDNTDPTTKPSGDTTTTTPDDKTPDQTEQEEKAKYYETYFSSEAFKFAGTSIKATSMGMDIELINAKDNTGLFKFGIGEAIFEIYKDATGEQYVHIKMMDEETQEMADAWYKFDPTTAEEGEEDIFGSMSEDLETDELYIDVESILGHNYVTTADGIDVVEVFVPNETYVEGAKNTYYDIKVTYEDKEYLLTYRVYTDGESEIATFINYTPDETIDFGDYDIDLENKVFTHEEDETKTIAFTIETTKEIMVSEQETITLEIDAESKKVISMTQVVDDIATTAEFMDVETATSMVTIPETVETIDAMSVAMMYFAFIMSAMGSMG